MPAQSNHRFVLTAWLSVRLSLTVGEEFFQLGNFKSYNSKRVGMVEIAFEMELGIQYFLGLFFCE